jgi:two-component system, OmpR family, alkaline phosphatase synthesis response regulator PhoP
LSIKRILVIDDELSLVMVLEELLSDEGYHVLTATGGQEGLTVLNSGHPPDLVIVDLKMPGTGGKVVVQTMRQNHKLNTLPVIILTGSVPHSADFPPEGSYHAVIYKPFHLEEVLAKVQELI